MNDKAILDIVKQYGDADPRLLGQAIKDALHEETSTDAEDPFEGMADVEIRQECLELRAELRRLKIPRTVHLTLAADGHVTGAFEDPDEAKARVGQGGAEKVEAWLVANADEPDESDFDPESPPLLFGDFDKEDGLAEYMLRGANALYEAWDDDNGDAYLVTDGDGWKLTLITGGWYDNEELLQRLPRVWQMTCWDRSERGGLHVFSYGEAAHIFAESDARKVSQIREALYAAGYPEHERNRVIDWLADRLAHPGTSRWPSPQSIRRSVENVLKPVVAHGGCTEGCLDYGSRLLVLACGHSRFQRMVEESSVVPDVAVCDQCPAPDHRIAIPSDDGPIDAAPALEIFGGEDWYVGVVRPGERRALEAVRFCTSGARSHAVTTTIALLDAVARGDNDKIHERIRSLHSQVHYGIAGPLSCETALDDARRGWALAYDDGQPDCGSVEGARRFAAQTWDVAVAHRLFPITEAENEEIRRGLQFAKSELEELNEAWDETVADGLDEADGDT